MVEGCSQLLSEYHELPLPLRTAFAALVTELQTLRRRDQLQRAALHRLEMQLESAASLQRDLLPAKLPAIRGLHVHTLYRPAETVSGDLYDIARVDDTKVAFTLADATGHGLPAGLLSALTRRSLAVGRRTHHGFAPPDRLLARANKDVLALCLTECQFVGALYAVFDECSRKLIWARAGLPYPILIRDGQPPRRLPSSGPALGTVSDAAFELVTVTLQPGDRILFHTDGVDSLLSARRPATPTPGWGKRQELSAPQDLTQTDWFAALGRQELNRQLHDLDDRLSDSRRAAPANLDDLTVVALQAK